VIVTPQKPDTPFDNSDIPPADASKTAEVQAALAKRMERIVVTDPQVQPDGTIMAKGQAIYLYGINPFDSKQLCTKSSKERWACGLHAYADLRNSVAQKTIICDPKSIRPGGVTAACRLGETNIAAMLVGHGLAEVAQGVTDSDLLKAQDSARAQRLGIWDR
jgi:endonuclease YncB( thermonuclease family)